MLQHGAGAGATGSQHGAGAGAGQHGSTAGPPHLFALRSAHFARRREKRPPWHFGVGPPHAGGAGSQTGGGGGGAISPQQSSTAPAHFARRCANRPPPPPQPRFPKPASTLLSPPASARPITTRNVAIPKNNFRFIISVSVFTLRLNPLPSAVPWSSTWTAPFHA